MARRIIRYNNFRNLGINDNSSNYLIINNSLEKGKMGSLIEIIGANNSGKSNVLAGIKAFGNKTIDKNDITTLSFDEDAQKPEISLCIQGNKEIIKKISLAGVSYEGDIDSQLKVKFTKDDLLKAADFLLNIVNRYGYYNNIQNDLYNLINTINNYDDEVSDGALNSKDIVDKLIDYKNKIESFLKQNDFIDRNSKLGIAGNPPRRGFNGGNVQDFKTDSKVFSQIKEDTIIEDNFKNEYGFRLTPRIVAYTEEMINANDLIVDIHNINDSKFFNSLFNAIGVKVSDITKGVEQYEQFRNPASLDKIQNMINKKMPKLIDRFNKLYFAESDKYQFSVKVESNLISFGMARGEDNDPIMIEQQSTGFRWFFNLYFNFMCSNSLERGDIVIMDEPATNLHPKGQSELRKFLKDFAMANDLTIIIATHVPFLIDVDNYEDIRVVTMENNRASIDNLFTAMNNNDPDTLLPIKDALTIKQSVLYDVDTEVIWVEGLTDYCYLTAFKNMLGIKNVSFVPFNGVGKNDEEREQILQKMKSAKFFKRGILLDSDKAGQAMAKKCRGTLFDNRIYMISDVSDKYQEIEDLFTDNDKKKWNIIKDGEIQKKASCATILKNFAKLEDFEEETIKNFKEVFKLFE